MRFVLALLICALLLWSSPAFAKGKGPKGPENPQGPPAQVNPCEGGVRECDQ